MPDFGATNIANFTSSAGSFTDTRAMGGQLPAIANMVLESVSLWTGTIGGLRMAVYMGGALDNPSGATLLEDFGATTAANSDWTTMSSVARPSLASSGIVWFMFKNPGGGSPSGWAVRFSNSAADAGDWQSARGRYSSTGITDDSPATPFPSTFPAGGSFSGSWFPCYITYSIADSGGSTGTPHYYNMRRAA